MNKSFVKDDGETEEPDDPAAETTATDEPPSLGYKNLMTPAGHRALSDELHTLIHVDRPKIVEIVSWAAGNGDRSENGDYLYNKKKLREMDRRLRYLTKRLEDAEIVDPIKQQGLDRVFFGATVTYVSEDDVEHRVKLVGVDEADLDQGKINWMSPVARALMKKSVGDSVELNTPNGPTALEIIDIEYELPRS